MDGDKNKIKEAGRVYKGIQDLATQRDVLVWEEARLWFQLKKDGLWKYVWGDSGDNIQDSWSQFVRASGVPLSTVEMKVRLYEFWIIEKGFPIEALSGIHTRKLDRAIASIKSGDQTVEEVLLQAQHLPYEEFIKWLKD